MPCIGRFKRGTLSAAPCVLWFADPMIPGRAYRVGAVLQEAACAGITALGGCCSRAPGIVAWDFGAAGPAAGLSAETSGAAPARRQCDLTTLAVTLLPLCVSGPVWLIWLPSGAQG